NRLDCSDSSAMQPCSTATSSLNASVVEDCQCVATTSLSGEDQRALGCAIRYSNHRLITWVPETSYSQAAGLTGLRAPSPMCSVSSDPLYSIRWGMRFCLPGMGAITLGRKSRGTPRGRPSAASTYL